LKIDGARLALKPFFDHDSNLPPPRLLPTAGRTGSGRLAFATGHTYRPRQRRSSSGYLWPRRSWRPARTGSTRSNTMATVAFWARRRPRAAVLEGRQRPDRSAPV